MNCSETTYGRKIVKGTHRKKSEYCKILYISWGVCFLIGLVIGVILFWGISSLSDNEPIESNTAPEFIEPIEPKIISLGEYMLTAYCACFDCTDKHPNDDAYGITKSGVKAVEGVTVAADPKVIPLGTEIIIDGHDYLVQDIGGAIKGNRIDVYFDSHQEALEFGVQHKEIFMKEGEM